MKPKWAIGIIDIGTLTHFKMIVFINFNCFLFEESGLALSAPSREIKARTSLLHYIHDLKINFQKISVTITCISTIPAFLTVDTSFPSPMQAAIHD